MALIYKTQEIVNNLRRYRMEKNGEIPADKVKRKDSGVLKKILDCFKMNGYKNENNGNDN